MAGVNKVILIGRLGGDPDIRYMESGAAVANMTLATSENWKDKDGQKQEKTEWHKVVMFVKTDKKAYIKDDAGLETDLTAGADIERAAEMI